MVKKNNKMISIIGPPGSGKTTQINKLIESLGKKFDIMKCRVPDMIHKTNSIATYLTKEDLSLIDMHYKEGVKAQGSGILAPLIFDEMFFNCLDKVHNKDLIILDGSPRGVQQVELFMTYDKLCAKLLVIELKFNDKPFERSVSRQFSRMLLNNDLDSTVKSVNTFKTKYRVYEEDTLIGLNLLKENGIKVITIDACKVEEYIHLIIKEVLYHYMTSSNLL